MHIPLLIAALAVTAAPAAPAAPAPTGLEPQPLVVEQLGLTMHLPTGAIVQRQQMAQTMTLSITDPAKPPAWRIRVQPLVPTTQDSTSESLAAEQMSQLKTTAQGLRVLTNRAATIDGLAGWSLIVLLETGGEATVSGWLILPSGEGAFLVFAIVATPDLFAATRPLLDRSFSTIHLQPVSTVNEQRMVRIKAGRSFLQTLTPERLRAVVGHAQWFRVYQPGSGGDREIAYSQIEVREGKRGQLNATRDESRYDATEQALGLLVKIQARLALDADRNNYADSIQTYWLAWDRSEESWSILATRRQGEAEATDAETGVRSAPTPGSPNGELTIIRSDSLTRRRDPSQWKIPDVYLSQAEHWVLGYLLPREPSREMELGYYFYQGSRSELAQRVDQWQPSTEVPGQWRLLTRLRPDAEPMTSIYGSDGKLIRQIHPDGSITAPSTPDEIRRLWQSQGLKWGGSKSLGR